MEHGRDLAEGVRVAYVAATRARDLLVVPAVGDAERDTQAAQAAGMYSLIAGFGYLGDGDRAGEWFQHGWLDSPLDLLGWLDKPQTIAKGAR